MLLWQNLLFLSQIKSIMTNITDLFESIIEQSGAIDIAIAEFKRMIADDSELRAEYKEWCEETGTTERNGFADFADEYVASREEKWDSLTDYDENE